MSVLSCQSPRNQRGAAECQSIICGRDQHQHRASRVTTAALVSTAMKRKNERKITSGDILRISHWRRIKKKQYGGSLWKKKKKKTGRHTRLSSGDCCVCILVSHKSSLYLHRQEGMSAAHTHPPDPSSSHSHVYLPVIHALEQRLQMPLSLIYDTSCATTFHLMN